MYLPNNQGNNKDNAAATAADPNSSLAWAAILQPGELTFKPPRDHPDYLILCEKFIENLSEKVAKAEELENVSRAEDNISGLMLQLHFGSGSHQRRSSPLPVTSVNPERL